MPKDKGPYKSMCGVVINLQNCNIVESESEHQSCNYVHFCTKNIGKVINLLIHTNNGLLVPLLYFYKNYSRKLKRHYTGKPNH